MRFPDEDVVVTVFCVVPEVLQADLLPVLVRNRSAGAAGGRLIAVEEATVFFEDVGVVEKDVGVPLGGVDLRELVPQALFRVEDCVCR